MLGCASNLMARVTKRSVLALVVVTPIAVGALPARGQDIFGFFKPHSPPVAPPIPSYHPLSDSAPLTVRVRPRKKVVRDQQAPIKAASVAAPKRLKDPGEIANPVPALLKDETLRSGDMVMFPGGLRVFAGRPGTDHALSDFEPLSRSGKVVPIATRKLVTQLRPGANAAWSTDAVKAGGKLAMNAKNFEPSGKVRQKSR